MSKILNYGSLNIDLVYSVDHFVKAGETLSANSVNIFPGGKGLNQSVALSHAGGEVYHAGKVGSDGLWLKELLREHGVNTNFVLENAMSSGTAIIQVIPKGQNCILINHGANGEITEEEIDETLSHFNKGDLLVLQNEINYLDKIISKAYAKGMTIALNPSPIDDGILNVGLDKITYFLLNEIEGEAITGESEPDKICKKLLEKFPNGKIVLTLGEKGVIYADSEKRASNKAYRVKAVDTTAAGDTFTGFFLSLVMNGETVEYALKNASKASAIAVSRQGAAKSVPTLDEVKSAQFNDVL